MPFKPSLDLRAIRTATTATFATIPQKKTESIANVAIGSERKYASGPGGDMPPGAIDPPRRCGECPYWEHLAGHGWWCGRCTMDGKAAGWKSCCRTGLQQGDVADENHC